MELPSQPQTSVILHTLDTVRVLHDTILTLSNALQDSHKMEEGESKDVDETGDEEGDEDVFEVFQNQKPESDEDIDDIELVFTTAETDPATINEDLVSIRDSNKTMHTVLIETDISKCGIVEELEANMGRRNTLPVPIPYRPIMHRDVLGTERTPQRIKAVTAKAVPKSESGAQTDITALPGQWKSDTYLAHKINYNLTTLPSKFTLPIPKASHVPLNNKTREARRVLLSDINFTSMVPELSRSADHLHKEEDTSQNLCKNYPAAFEYMKSFDVGRDGRNGRCCDWTRHGSRSSWGSYYGSKCQASSTSIGLHQQVICPCEVQTRRRHSWRPPSAACCHHPGLPWSSVPSSPTRCISRPADVPRKKVSFRPCSSHVHPGQSLPDLRDMDGDSTDSLVDEAEEFLRHQIDAMLVGRRGGRSRRVRRMSEADTFADFDPPKSAQPFLPRSPRDLKHGYLVKVISSEGRVVLGRVRYSGTVSGRSEPHVGVQLPLPTGVSDGTFQGQRYFEWYVDRSEELVVGVRVWSSVGQNYTWEFMCLATEVSDETFQGQCYFERYVVRSEGLVVLKECVTLSVRTTCESSVSFNRSVR